MSNENNFYKLSVDLKEGWHGFSNETLWGEKVGEGLYRIDNIPFFANGISDGDIVKAEVSEDGLLKVKEVVERSGQVNCRVIFEDETDEATRKSVLKQLQSFGDYECYADFGLYAFSIPQKHLKPFSTILAELEEILDYEIDRYGIKDRIAIAGASGFVGQALQSAFVHTVIIGRDDSIEEIIAKLKGVDVLINLAGAPIIKRWSDNYKKLLYTSRIETTRKLVEAVNRSDINYFISTSAIGIYPNDKPCDETCMEYADDFLGKLCADWEKEALKCQKPTAVVRMGVVLGKEGGALRQMLLPFKLGLGGTIGDGKMMTSWIAIDDLVRMYGYLIEHKLAGIFNAVSPHPVSNAVLTKILGKVLHRPTFFPLPVAVLKLIYGEAASVMTDSKEVYPKALLDVGFVFDYPMIEEALGTILHLGEMK